MKKVYCLKITKPCTLDSRIEVGQGINVRHGKFDKKNKCRAFNKSRKLENMEKIQKVTTVGPLIRP